MDVGRWRYLSRIMAYVDLVLVLGLAVPTILVGISVNTLADDSLSHNLEKLEGFIRRNNFSDKTVAVLRKRVTIDSLSNSADLAIWLIGAMAILFITALLLLCQSIFFLFATSKSAEKQDALEITCNWQICNAIMLILSSIFCVVFVVQDTSTVNWFVVVPTLVFMFTRALFLFIVCNFIKELKQGIPSSSKAKDLDVEMK